MIPGVALPMGSSRLASPHGFDFAFCDLHAFAPTDLDQRSKRVHYWNLRSNHVRRDHQSAPVKRIGLGVMLCYDSINPRRKQVFGVG